VLTICLNSCNGRDIILPVIDNHERCASFIEEIKPGIFTGKCRCHEYQVSEEYIGRVGDSYDEKLSYCSNKISFSPTTWSNEYLYFFDEIFFMRSKSRQKARRNLYNREVEKVFE
jgi:hypothetical protein